jgi:hypothetical protein
VKYYIILSSLEGTDIYKLNDWNEEIKEFLLWACSRSHIVGVIKGEEVTSNLSNRFLKELYDDLETDIKAKEFYQQVDTSEDKTKLDKLKKIFAI